MQSAVKFAETFARKLQREGPITVADFIALANGHYYMTRDPLGAAGDFITAPEISPLFGEMIGLWLVNQWLELGSPARFHLIELGPGRGTLMRDILLAAAQVRPEFVKAVQVHLIETSESLRAKQAEALKDYTPQWHDRLETVPQDAPWLVVANEFFDALPVHQFLYLEGRWVERYVAYSQEKGFHFTAAPSRLAVAFGQGVDGPQDGAVYEVSPISTAIARHLKTGIETHGGAALIIDYSTKNGAGGDTLQAVKAHQRCDVLEHIGDADLTAHVDFSALKNAFAPLKTSLQTQGAFLTDCGILHRLAALPPETQTTLKSGVARLIDSAQMGELFKVLSVTK